MPAYQAGSPRTAAPIWKRKRPKSLGKPVPLTPKQKAAAKAMAQAAGRTYPNLVDNIAASRLENPTMKKPTPAQLAARARFAEMARSGAFKKKAASKRKKNPAGVSEAKTVRELKTVKQMREWFGSLTDALTDAEVQYMKSQFITLGYGDFVPGQIPANVFYRAQIDATRLHPTVKRKANPAKKTVSQKISQLTREGYPQKQAVAIALSEERAGKVKRNPVKRGRAPSIAVGDYVRSYDFPGMHDDHYLEGVVTSIGNGVYSISVSRRVVGGEEKSIPASLRQVSAPMGPHFMTGVYGVQKLGRKSNPRASNPATGEKRSRTKLNPVMPEARSRLPSNFKYGVQTKATENWALQAAFKTKAEAVDYAQAIAKNYPRLPIRVITFTGGPI